MKTIIGGSINADGTVQSGTGFTCTKRDVGIYEVEFLQPFSSVPAVLLTQNYPAWEEAGTSGSTLDNCVIVAVDAHKIRIKTGNSDHEAADRNFCFMAFSKEGTTMKAALVAGLVDANGDIHGGSGFTVSRTGPGLYLVTLDKPLTNFPVAVAKVNYPAWGHFHNNNDGSTLDNAVIVAANREQVLFKTGDKEGNDSDRNFVFFILDPNVTGAKRRVISGDVNANGSRYEGAGFVIVHDADGLYNYVYTEPFANTPAVIPAQNYPDWDDFTSNGGWTIDNATVVAVNDRKVQVKTGDGLGDATDRNNCFVVVETL